MHRGLSLPQGMELAMIRLTALVLALLPGAVLAQHADCVIRDDPHMTCVAGTAWDAEIGGCMPIVSG